MLGYLSDSTLPSSRFSFSFLICVFEYCPVTLHPVEQQQQRNRTASEVTDVCDLTWVWGRSSICSRLRLKVVISVVFAVLCAAERKQLTNQIHREVRGHPDLHMLEASPSLRIHGPRPSLPGAV